MRRAIGLILIGLVMPNIAWAERFSKSGDVVYDSKTELRWQSSPSTEKFTWQEAKGHCEGLGSSWRLPNLYELKSLVDYGNYNPAIATALIDIDTNYPYYWSSSEYVSDSSNAWYVNFEYGHDFWRNKSHHVFALCVR